MKLSKQDLGLFYKLHPSLLTYVNQELKVIRDVVTIKDFMSLDLQEKATIRNKLYEHIDLIGQFCKQNPFHFTGEELSIVQSWKLFIKDKFYLLRHLKKYSIFISNESPPKAYGVVALTDTFEAMYPYLPVLLEVVLLPFKQQIIYDGFMLPYSVVFGSGIRRDLNDAYEKAKSEYGIIDKLPYVPPTEKKSNADLLLFYMKNEKNRTNYRDEIASLIHKEPGLTTLYHQEMGKIGAKKYKKHLHYIGIHNAWFAVLEGIIIASGRTKPEVQKLVNELVPKEKINFVYIFQVK